MIMKKNPPELVSPAGDWACLQSAIAGGCNSVYFGLKGLNMRGLSANFDVSELKKITALLHKNKVKAYLALNVIIYNHELKKLESMLKAARQAKVDAVILWDMAVFSLARKLGLRVHLSTQASVSNFSALKQYSLLGARRVVLARECKLKSIKAMTASIKRDGLDCEVEAFVHGAMCLSLSGRCFLSGYSFAESANRGRCLQPCRREFLISDVQEAKQYILGKDHILSPKDLCALDFIDKLIDSGVRALKIEGRARSPEYVGVVTSVYRRAIDAYLEGELSAGLKQALKRELKTVYNRGFSEGFYFGDPSRDRSRELEAEFEKVYSGEVLKYYGKIRVAEIKVSNAPLKKGDQIICLGRNTPASFARLKEMQINHEFVDIIEKGSAGGIKLPFKVNRNDKVFIWRRKK
jgi:putative protease